MSHRRSIVHHFFPLNVQVLEKSFSRKSCSNKKKLTQNYFKKHQFCSHNKYMSHQMSVVHHFFPLNVQVLEKNFLRKSYSLVKTNTKLL